jgi:hypothetical protein
VDGSTLSAVLRLAVRPGVPWPSAVGVAGAVAAGYVVAVDPSEAAVSIACAFHAATGWWCPGCGLTRAAHHLLRGDIGTALSYHALVPIVLGAGLWAWLAWWWPSVSSRSLPGPVALPARVWIALGSALIVFAVLRNVALFAPLAP